MDPASLVCSTCGRHAAWPRHFCGGCRAVLRHRCTACGFANELDDAWCGGCGASLARNGEIVEAPPHNVPARPRVPVPPPSRAGAGAALAARLVEANRRGVAPRSTPGAQDQDQVDALFASEP